MLKIDCLHPEMLKTTACMGHGDKLLIVDGNYPVDTNTNKEAVKIYLNLTRGIPNVTNVLDVISKTIAIEKAEVMMPDSGQEPQIYDEFRKVIGNGMELEKHSRFEFYDECKKEGLKMVIITGETRIYANLLLTMGVA